MTAHIKDSKAIEQFINTVTDETVPIACNMLDEFWRNHCEIHKTFLCFLHWTSHDHAAKGTWANLDYLLRQRIKELKSSE